MVAIAVLAGYFGTVIYRQRGSPAEENREESFREVVDEPLVHLVINFVVDNVAILAATLFAALIVNLIILFWSIGSLMRAEVVSVRAMKVPLPREKVFSKVVQDSGGYLRWVPDITSVDRVSGDGSWVYTDKQGRRFEVTPTEDNFPESHVRVAKCVHSPLPGILGLIHTVPLTTYVFEFSESRVSRQKAAIIFVTKILQCGSPLIRFFICLRSPSAGVEKFLLNLAKELKVQDPKIVRPKGGKFEFGD